VSNGKTFDTVTVRCVVKGRLLYGEEIFKELEGCPAIKKQDLEQELNIFAPGWRHESPPDGLKRGTLCQFMRAEEPRRRGL